MSSPVVAIEQLERFCEGQIQSAGQRYSPGVDPGAPNLKNEPLLVALASLACGAEAKARRAEMLANLGEAWANAKADCAHPGTVDAHIVELRTIGSSSIDQTRNGDASALDQYRTCLAAMEKALQDEQAPLRDEERRLIEKQLADHQSGAPTPSHSAERDAFRDKIARIGRCVSILSDELEFVSSSAGRLLCENLLLLRGEWGTGKTHFLCDVVRARYAHSKATVLALAKNFQDRNGVLNVVADTVRPSVTPAQLIDDLDRFGARIGERAFVIVDGVNEGPREAWKDAVRDLVGLVRPRRNVALIVSCRTPFETVAIADADRSAFVPIEHRGFADQEFDAQAEFFRYYKLPLSEVPLLDEEFSRPLTLKLICQAFQQLSGKKLQQGFSGIASGQKGMTYVLESFVHRIGRTIERQFGLPDKSCWRLLKGSPRIANRVESGFAPHMAMQLRDHIGPRAALRIIRAHFPRLAEKNPRNLLEALRSNGLLDEDVVWRRGDGAPRKSIVYRLPYQRFSDHLIARHLLDAHLDKANETAVRRSFARGKPLSRVFRSRGYGYEYKRPGWAQALITEFPEAVKRVVQPNVRELYFFLPASNMRLAKYFAPFSEGLFWRDRAAFTDGTRRVINLCLTRATDDGWHRLTDALVALATKSGHPYNSARFYRFLSGMQMPPRDLCWSEYLRKGYRSPTVRRLLKWAEQLEGVTMHVDAAREMITLLSLLLTTVVRRDRDLVTKTLVLIGERYPKELFEHTIATLSFNDPYVPERMLAAAYGVTMSMVDGASKREFRPVVSDFARCLYKMMFAPGASHATHHVLRRDYALGTIDIACRAVPGCLARRARKYLGAPFAHIASPFPQPAAIADEQCADGNSAIQMDFGNYTIGHLIKGRDNYDNEHPEYRDVRRQIEQRIGALGYKERDFASIDGGIGRESFYAETRGRGKVDRYGKKYSWIAYFEMYGLREANAMLNDWRQGERVSECDIDPSFPKRPPKWNPPMPEIFGNRDVPLAKWVGRGPVPDFSRLLVVDEINGAPGPWVLLEGWVHGKQPDLERESFTFLRGLMVRSRDVDALRRLFMRIEYPGNDAIPRAGEEMYMYAGEAGRSERFAPDLRTSDGIYRRQVREAFGRHEWIPDRGAHQGRGRAVKSSSASVTEETLEGFHIRIHPPLGKSRHIPGVRVELPTRGFGWESYHSELNDFSGFDFPAPALIERLGLHSVDREIDFRDGSGLAALYREGDPTDKNSVAKFLYLREDLLRAYLQRTRQQLVWCTWGERNAISHGERSTQDVVAVIQKYQHIHRRFFRFRDWRRSA